MSAFFSALFPVFVCHLYVYSVGDRFKKRLVKAAPSRPLFLLILFVIHLPLALVFIAVPADVSLTKWFDFCQNIGFNIFYLVCRHAVTAVVAVAVVVTPASAGIFVGTHNTFVPPCVCRCKIMKTAFEDTQTI